jgi:hypothetical protein
VTHDRRLPRPTRSRRPMSPACAYLLRTCRERIVGAMEAAGGAPFLRDAGCVPPTAASPATASRA